jgi:clan AA aspartic protease
MGLTYAMISLVNPRNPALKPIEAEALADTGAVYLCIPEYVRSQLQLEECAKKEVITADGSRHLAPYVGPVQVRFKNRTGYFGAVVLGDQVLLGAIPMEDMDLVITPKGRKIDVNPESPDVASAFVK